MFKYVISLATILVLFISACNAPNRVSNSDVHKYEVNKTIEEQIQDDFHFRLVSEKQEYEVGADIKLYGEITYIGDKEEVTIHHSSSAILFSLKEEVRGFDIGFGVNDIGLSTVLVQGEPYREKYAKSGGYAESDPSDYVKFMKHFLDSSDFPPGYYIVEGETDFSLANNERVNMKATIDFKVVE